MTKYILGHSSTKKLNNIIFHTEKLDENQMKRFNEYKKKARCDPKNISDSIIKLNRRREYDCYYVDPTLTIDKIKIIMIDHVKKYTDPKMFKIYDNLVNLVVSTLKDMCDVYPFKDEEKMYELVD